MKSQDVQMFVKCKNTEDSRYVARLNNFTLSLFCVDYVVL